MAGPTNTGITGEDRDEEQDIDLNQDDPKEAVTAGLTEDQIGLNARQQSELSDPTRPENFAGAKTAQTVTDEVGAADPGYSSGHDSVVSQKEQYDTALAGASHGRHAGTYLDYLVAQRKFIEEQRKRDIAHAAAMATLPGLMNAIIDLGKDYDEEAKEQDAVNEQALAIKAVFDEQIEFVDKNIAETEEIIKGIQEDIERNGYTQNAQVQLDAANERLQVMQEIRQELSNEAEELVKANADRAEKFAEAQANHTALEARVAKGIEDGSMTEEEAAAALKESSDALREAQDARLRVEQRIDNARDHGEMLKVFIGDITERNPDGTYADSWQPGAIMAKGAMISAYISARSDGYITPDELKDLKDKMDATNMTDAEKQMRMSMIESKFAQSGLGLITEDGRKIYGEEAAAALVAGLRGEIEQTNEQFSNISTVASTMVNQLAEQRQGLADDVAKLDLELQYLQDMKEKGSSDIELPEGSSVFVFSNNLELPGGADNLALGGNERDMLEAQIILKQAELNNATSRLNLIEVTIDNTRTQLEETGQKYAETNGQLQDLIAQRSSTSGDDLTKLNADIAELEGQLETYKQSVIDLSERADMARAISELSIRIEGKSNSCGIDANAELFKAGVIDKRTDIINALKVAAHDGKMTQDEFNQINALFDDAQVSQASRLAFVEAFTKNGGLLGTGELDADGNEIFLSREETTAQLMREMAQVEAEIEQTSAELDSLRAEVAAKRTEVEQLNTAIQTAQEAVNKETTKTAEVEADAEGAVAGRMEYTSMSDYVMSNFHYGVFGNKEKMSLADAVNDPNMILKDDQGNAVYMDNETQELYTLDANGEKVAVRHEDTVDLYNEMFENKLLPRNFMPDGDGILGFGSTEVAFEPSKHDSFLGTVALALRGNMGEEQFNENVAKSVAAQRAEQDAALAEKAELEGKSGGKAAELAALEGDRSAASRELAALEQRLSNMQAQANSGNNSNNDATSGPALRTSNEMQLALQDVHSKVDQAAGVITREDLDQALGANASPELREQIEAALERDGIEIQEPDDPDNSLANNVENTDVDIEVRTTSAMTASFPFLGIGPFQVEPIQTNTFQPDPNNIYPGPAAIGSFADNEFAETHAPGDASYKEPINNGTSTLVAALEKFSEAIANKLNTESQGGVSAEEALRLEREEELRMAANNPVNQGGGGMLT